MISISEFEDELKAALVDKERAAVPSSDFVQRLRAAGESSTRPRRGIDVRRVSRWLPPLVAAAAVAAVAIVGLAVTSSPSASRPTPATTKPHVAGPTVIHSTGAPPGFAAHGMFFLDAEHGWALGNARCAAKARVCATLLKTVDGGDHWTRIGVPNGLVPVDDGDGVPKAGSCSTNGGRLGPCIDNVLFTDDAHGYAWSHNFFYWTTDGGATWRDGHSRADHVVRIGSEVFRARPVADCSTCLYRVERATIGSNNWLDVTPGHRDRFGVSLLAAGNILYASAGSLSGGPGGLYRSSDLGATWQPLTWPCDPSQNAAPDGSFACVAEQSHGAVRAVSVDGRLGTSYPLPTDPADVYVAAPTQFVAFWGGPVYWTGDSGRTWHKVAQFAVHDNGYLSGVFAGSRGFFVSNYGTATYTTHDGGLTWHRYEFS